MVSAEEQQVGEELDDGLQLEDTGVVADYNPSDKHGRQQEFAISVARIAVVNSNWNYQPLDNILQIRDGVQELAEEDSSFHVPDNSGSRLDLVECSMAQPSEHVEQVEHQN